jgi:polyphenol oxidase
MVIKERYEHFMKRHKLEQQPENLVYYTYTLFEPFSSQLLCTTSTRLGGVSEGPLHSLNLSTRVGDDEHHVNTNRLRLCGVMNIEPEMVAQAQLVHGNHIEVITEQSPKGFSYKFPTTDGLVTNVAQVPLFIPVADCAAVAFFDPQQRVIGMLHSGWKGVVHHIIPAMISTMHTVYGSDPTHILVGVSPCLGPCCYEVREDFIHTVTEAFSIKAKDFLIPQADDTIHFDMWSALRWQLEENGILPEHVEGPTLCTACSVDEFYSHRKERGKTGRFASVIVLRP